MGAQRWMLGVVVAFLTSMVFVGVDLLQGHAASMMAVNVADATVMGQSQKILVDEKGMTLYYLTSDTAMTPACTGGCPKVWPPLLSTGTPTGPSSLPGKLAVEQTANGSQVTYNGHLLYRYATDMKPGDVTGDGKTGPKNGTWHVATPTTKSM